MKIGIMGGTFDPIHLAHIKMGHVAMEQKKLDQIWFMPSKIPPHKQDRKIAEEKHRYRWVELAIRGEKGFLASDFELTHVGTTYTADTLERLGKNYPEHQFFFILGGDSLFYFGKWYHPEKILTYAEILSVSRNGISMEKMEEQARFLMNQFGGKIEVLPMQEMKVSSSMIREKIAKGESVEQYLPEGLYQVMAELQEEYRK